MATPEGKVKRAIRKVLDEFKPDVFYDMPVPSGYGRQSLDFIGCAGGKYFAIEAKAPGKKPTPRQVNTIAERERAGGKCFVIDGEAGCASLRFWLTLNVGK